MSKGEATPTHGCKHELPVPAVPKPTPFDPRQMAWPTGSKPRSLLGCLPLGQPVTYCCGHRVFCEVVVLPNPPRLMISPGKPSLFWRVCIQMILGNESNLLLRPRPVGCQAHWPIILLNALCLVGLPGGHSRDPAGTLSGTVGSPLQVSCYGNLLFNGQFAVDI